MTDIAQTFGMSLSFFRHDYHVHLTFLAGLKYRAKTLLAILSRVTRERKRGRGGKNSARDCAECAESASRVYRECTESGGRRTWSKRFGASRARPTDARFTAFLTASIPSPLATFQSASQWRKEAEVISRRKNSGAVDRSRLEHKYGTTSGVERGIIHRPFVGRTTGI